MYQLRVAQDRLVSYLTWGISQLSDLIVGTERQHGGSNLAQHLYCSPKAQLVINISKKKGLRTRISYLIEFGPLSGGVGGEALVLVWSSPSGSALHEVASASNSTDVAPVPSLTTFSDANCL